jgi:hypothetical protein
MAETSPMSASQKNNLACWFRDVFSSLDPAPNTDPKKVLAEIMTNNGIKMITSGKQVLLSKFKEELQVTPQGKQAIALVQRGLIALRFLKIQTDECGLTPFEFGIYGPKTIQAVTAFQKSVGISYTTAKVKTRAGVKKDKPLKLGEMVDKRTIEALKTWLAKIR